MENNNNIELSNNTKSKLKTSKLMLIIASILVVLYSLNGDMVRAIGKGAAPLTSYESFYAYIITIGIAIYNIINNKEANTMIGLALLTYVWTYYLVNKDIASITDEKMVIEPFFYAYLSSSVFLFISLFINEKKQQIK